MFALLHHPQRLGYCPAGKTLNTSVFSLCNLSPLSHLCLAIMCLGDELTIISSTFSQVLMGIFFYTHSVALAEDLNVSTNYTDLEHYSRLVDASYEQVSMFLWYSLARLLYI